MPQFLNHQSSHRGPMADRVHRSRSHMSAAKLDDLKRRLAAAILANTVEAFFSTALLNLHTGRLSENQDVQIAKEAIADRAFTGALFRSLSLSRSGCVGAARAFERLSALRTAALRAARLDPQARFIAHKDRLSKNMVHVRLLRLFGKHKMRGIYLAAQHLGVDFDAVFPKRKYQESKP